jgi:tetraacyldisaccharide 4'-kinase
MMEKIWLKIINDKSNPLHWPALALLWVASILYRRGLWVNSMIGRKTAKTRAPLISIGNLTVGGSGKTPITIETARYFLERGLKTAIVSSGFGRKSKKDFIVTGAELQFTDAAIIGDEPKLMAEVLPSAIFSVSGSKTRAALTVDEKKAPDIIVVDDAYQHRRLRRDFNLLVVDMETDLRRESLFPLGRLREPLSGIERADGIIIARRRSSSNNEEYLGWLREKLNGKPWAIATYFNDEIISGGESLPAQRIKDNKVIFFAGLGNAGALENQVKSLFPKLARIFLFPDHHHYRQVDIENIKSSLMRHKPAYLITTQKDFVKVRDFDFGQAVYYLNLRIGIQSRESFFAEVEKVINK